jgi:hypothetical protein
MKAEITLTPAESKRLIAKAVVGMEAVRRARKKGILIICRGSTTAYVLEELQGSKVEKGRYTAGYIGPKGLEVNPKIPREMILVDGKVKEGATLADTAKELKPGDVVIKGANAIGPDGIPGNLIGRENLKTTGGTVGTFQMTAMARGVDVIVPIGLEKYIPVSVLVGSKKLSSGQVDYATGMPCGLIPIFGTVVTEVEALKMMADVEVTPIASGGIGGAEGSVTLLVEGVEAHVRKVIGVIEGIKGEASVQEPK